MCKALLGNTIDIHFGGVEHIPVHHTNERAQSETANGVTFVKYWLHNEHLLVDDKKMAKSEGTGFSLQEIVDHGYDPLTLRYFFLQAHYRSKQNFTWEGLEGAKNALGELREKVSLWKKDGRCGEIKNHEYATAFQDVLSDDLNIPKALAIAWEMTKADIPDAEKLSLIFDFDRILGLGLAGWRPEKIPERIAELIRKRNDLRREKRYKESDELRKKIEEAGFRVEDDSISF